MVKKKSKKTIWTVIIVLGIIALFLVISHYTGFIDFKELFVVVDKSAPLIYDGIPGQGGAMR